MVSTGFLAIFKGYVPFINVNRKTAKIDGSLYFYIQAVLSKYMDK